MKKKLYVAIDVQNDFVTGCLGSHWADMTSKNIIKYLASVKDKEDTYGIWATQDTHDPDTYETSLEGIKLPVPHCLNGSKGWELIDGLKPLVDKVISKPTFMSTELGTSIAELKDELDEVIFVGFCTSICVVSNVLLTRGLLPDMKLTVKNNLCADVSEEAHKAALLVMNNCQVDTDVAVGECEDCVEEEVIKLIQEVPGIEISYISTSSRISEDLHMDSIDYSEVLLTLEERFAVAFGSDDFDSIRTVGDIVDTINKLRTTNTINYGNI